MGKPDCPKLRTDHVTARSVVSSRARARNHATGGSDSDHFRLCQDFFTPIGKQAAEELAAALKEQRPDRIKLVGHTDVRGSTETT